MKILILIQDQLMVFQKSFYLTKNYREAYNLFACSGILFNHEAQKKYKFYN